MSHAPRASAAAAAAGGRQQPRHPAGGRPDCGVRPPRRARLHEVHPGPAPHRRPVAPRCSTPAPFPAPVCPVSPAGGAKDVSLVHHLWPIGSRARCVTPIPMLRCCAHVKQRAGAPMTRPSSHGGGRRRMRSRRCERCCSSSRRTRGCPRWAALSGLQYLMRMATL